MSLACLRSFFLPAFLASLAVLVASFRLESVVGLVPCALCFSQRVMLGLYALVCFAAAMHAPAARGKRGYAWLTLLMAVGGALLAGRHVWLQGDPMAIDGCHLPVGQLLQRPLGEIVNTFLLGSPDCVSISWSFLDLTLPEWSLLAFLMLATLPLSWLVAYRFRNHATG
ncbi:MULTISPECIES: disulfide bond formation protein B [unclassified Pseudomonas]|uniref:disulfide bond formation protein B n=1 Tax=unclassified Pseudomonas TaxID=196821 RepID=UPI0024499175|nr:MULTISPECIES: disulfide bond formation protein B [unclassified Pseudomonas]MDH0302550.1 disulfide bond formation protein B [Pseudomonas sp. GD04091]MDH1983731.1 disulfide bond formation protein B [Pseudomonas sp. GD03689]